MEAKAMQILWDKEEQAFNSKGYWAAGSAYLSCEEFLINSNLKVKNGCLRGAIYSN